MQATQSPMAPERSLRLNASLEETSRARRVIEELAPSLGFSPERIFDMSVAVSEAVANAIEHTSGSGEVRVDAYVHLDRLEIEIRGPGEFRPPAQADGREHRGLGLPLMATLSDHLALYSVPDGGTLVSLTFYRPQAERRTKHNPLPPSQLELLEESSLVATMLKAAPVAFHIVDPNLRYKYVSPRYISLLDRPYQPAEVVGMPYAEVRSPLPIPGKDGLMARVSFTGEPAEFQEIEYEPPGQEPRYFTWQAVALGAGPPFDVLTIITEVTDQVVARKQVAAVNRELRAQTEELKRSEEELRRSREELEVAVAGSGGAEWEIRIDPSRPKQLPDHMTGSPRMKALIGFAEDELPDSLSAWLERIHPEDLGRVRASAQAHAEGRIPIHAVEYRIRHKDGSWRWLSSSGRLFRDEEGRPTRWAGLEWDITERKGEEEAAGVREQALVKAQSVSQTGSWRLDLNRGELLWSDEVYRMFGVPRGTPLTYEKFLSCVHPDDRAYVDRSWSAALQGAPYDIEHRIVAAGQVRWVRERAELEFSAEGALRGGFGTVQDITERREAEAALRQTQEERAQYVAQLEAVLGSLSEGLVVSDVEGNLFHWNQAAVDMHGFASEEEGRKQLAEFEQIFELATLQGRPLPLEEWPLARILRGESLSGWEIKLRKRNSEWRRVFSYGGRLARDEHGRPLLAVVTIIDVTDRKSSERERERLLARQGELAAQLAAANEGLQQRNRELARLYQEQRAIADYLQEALLNVPATLPDVRFGHVYHSATELASVGGDFYDIFGAREGRVGILMGDVSGHGVEAARIATMVKDSVHAFAHHFRRPHHVLRETNRLLIEKNVPGFVTAFLAFLEPETGSLTYASAGHPNPVVSTPGSATTMLESTCSPLGVFIDAAYRDHRFQLRDGQLLVLYTDGITEARADDSLFGETGLTRSLERHRDVPVEDLPSRLLDEVLAFSGGVLRDDAAVLALKLNT
jgi:PAS domain S-box-containing protein